MSIGFSTMNAGMADTTVKNAIINNLINLNTDLLSQTEISAMIKLNKNPNTCETITTNTTITDEYECIPVDSSGGAVTLTLAADETFNPDKVFAVNNVGGSANNIIINTDGTAKFYGYGIAGGGVTTLTIAVIGGQIEFRKIDDNYYFVYLKQLT